LSQLGKLVRPRPRLPARRCGRSSLTPPARRHEPAATRKSHNNSPTPARRSATRSPGQFSTAPDNWGPHGCGDVVLFGLVSESCVVLWGLRQRWPVRRSVRRAGRTGRGCPDADADAGIWPGVRGRCVRRQPG